MLKVVTRCEWVHILEVLWLFHNSGIDPWRVMPAVHHVERLGRQFGKAHVAVALNLQRPEATADTTTVAPTYEDCSTNMLFFIYTFSGNA
jgi:hypothetical protein